MYKVVIVEDEILVRIGLKTSVDWGTFNMEVVADLPNGQAALDYCRDNGPVDLIITDIKMPRMDGMELISTLRKHNKSTRVVILSCLEEFEYIRQAMSLGVSNYILKLTMTEEEIAEVLQGVRMDLDAQQSAYNAPKEREGFVPVPIDMIKEKYMKDFLLNGIYSAYEFEKFVIQSNMQLTSVRLVACTMCLDSYYKIKQKFQDEHGHLIKMSLLNLLYEITGSFQRGEAVFLDETHYLLLFSFQDVVSEQAIMHKTYEILHVIQAAANTYFKSSVSFGISGIQSGYQSLRKLCSESSRALDKKFLTGPGHMHVIGDFVDLSILSAQAERMRDYPELRRILSPVMQEEYDQYIQAISQAISEEKKPIRVILSSFIQWLNINLYSDHHSEKALLFSETELLEQCDTLPEMMEQVNQYIIKSVKQSQSFLHMNSDISKAVQYIKMNYNQSISLHQVADHVNLSFGYLSNLFKKELNVTFIEYLNGYRIERAKEMLIRTHLKSYDIAAKVGFSAEYTYFSKVFKKMTGCNPNKYRRQFMAGTRGAK